MDILDEDIIALWRELNLNNVDYIMIGGFASILHGVNRITQDIDIWIRDTIENRKRLRQTIKKLDLGDFKELETMQFVPGWTCLNITKGMELDIYTELKAFPQDKFDYCYKNAFIAEIEQTPVRFLHINDLLFEKQIVARPKDLLDVEELHKIINFNKSNNS